MQVSKFGSDGWATNVLPLIALLNIKPVSRLSQGFENIFGRLLPTCERNYLTRAESTSGRILNSIRPSSDIISANEGRSPGLCAQHLEINDFISSFIESGNPARVPSMTLTIKPNELSIVPPRIS
jgi:hypothetical protein